MPSTPPTQIHASSQGQSLNESQNHVLLGGQRTHSSNIREHHSDIKDGAYMCWYQRLGIQVSFNGFAVDAKAFLIHPFLHLLACYSIQLVICVHFPFVVVNIMLCPYIVNVIFCNETSGARVCPKKLNCRK